MYDSLAYEDFERVMRRSFWRKVRARLLGENNELLPYDLVRENLPYKGQRDIGLQNVPLDKIVGSVGRYRDFDRAFLPTHRQNTNRWVNIRKAHYEDVILPPVELYKIGDVYFVKDGNHRVSVARERDQAEIDAFVTEIDIPFKLTADMAIDEVQLQKAHGAFLQQTGLDVSQPDADLLLSNPANYTKLHEHINAHRYYLGTELQADVPYDLAVNSWYDNVYKPMADAIVEQGLDEEFPDLTLADLYLWVSEYQWLLREASQDAMAEDEAREEAYDEMADIYKQRDVRQIIRRLRYSSWVDRMIRDREEAAFLEKTRIYDIRPEANIVATLPGKYEKILDHIDVHHYYMGLNEQRDVSYEEAVASWYDEVYAPLVELIREQNIMEHFPGRTETDAYIWAMDHREALEQGEEPPDGTPPWLHTSLYPESQEN
ncbi:MAG: DUF4032 domain-containing protein [Chloroflexota bacterium]